MRNHRAVLCVYKDGEGCGLGRLWQEICKFTAHREKGFGKRGVPLLQAQLEEETKKPRQKPARSQGPGVCWKKGERKLSGISKGSISPANRAWHERPSWAGG